jgi:hypothetical protein
LKNEIKTIQKIKLEQMTSQRLVNLNKKNNTGNSSNICNLGSFGSSGGIAAI